MPVLTRPSVVYQQSFLEALREAQASGSGLASTLKLDVARLEADFGAYVQHRLDFEQREMLAPGLVQQSEFWLVENQEYLGLLKLRHELNQALQLIGGHIGYEIRPSKRGQGLGKNLLALGLLKARALGLHRVLLTCDDDNLASYRVMEANGAQLEDVIRVEGHHKPVRRYWIILESEVSHRA